MSEIVEDFSLKSQLKAHFYDWKSCTACSLGCEATHHVFFDYKLGADGKTPVVFIGEAPGESEDMIGKPFVGRSGKLLRNAINQYAGSTGWLITNINACRPRDEEGHNRPPTMEEILACRPRLVDVLEICKPTVVVLIGRTAQFSYPPKACGEYLKEIVQCLHPSYILRGGGTKHPQYNDQFEAPIAKAFKIAQTHA